MGNIAAKIAVFVLMINLAGAIMSAAIPSIAPPLAYNAEMNENFIGGLNGTVESSADAADDSTRLDRLFDATGLSFVIKWTSTFIKSLTAFPSMLNEVFGEGMDEPFRTTFFYFFETAIYMVYFIGVVSLFIGSDVIK